MRNFVDVLGRPRRILSKKLKREIVPVEELKTITDEWSFNLPDGEKIEIVCERSYSA